MIETEGALLMLYGIVFPVFASVLEGENQL